MEAEIAAKFVAAFLSNTFLMERWTVQKFSDEEIAQMILESSTNFADSLCSFYQEKDKES